MIDLYIKFKEADSFDHRSAIIGLNYYNEFISELKERGLIKGYDFSFKYTIPMEDKGELIIGDLPHIYDDTNYDEKNLRTAKLINEPMIEWSLNFDVLIIKNHENKNVYHLEIDEKALFLIEEFFITGSNKYLNYIEENFFQKYIHQNICRKRIHHKAYYDEIFFHIICDIENEKNRKEFFDVFPELILYQKEMNYNFTLDAKDLFTIIPDGKRFLFNVDFMMNSNKWTLGKPFFKKYQLLYLIDNKVQKINF